MDITISKRTMETVRSYTYMTDRFMSRAFDEDVAQVILPIIMNRPLKVMRVTPQFVAEDFFAKGCRFDVFAQDDSGKYYNIEVQNAEGGADERRARYNCERADSMLIHKGQEYKDYPDLYVIFITQTDYLGYGEPIYHINRYIKENGELFDDGQQIIYVNGTVKDPSTALGQLMIDMQQSDYTKILNRTMANKMKELKEGTVFHAMCSEVEKLTAEIAAEAAAEATAKANAKAAKAAEETAKKAAEENARTMLFTGVAAYLDCGLDTETVIKKAMEKYGVSREKAEAAIAAVKGK